MKDGNLEIPVPSAEEYDKQAAAQDEEAVEPEDDEAPRGKKRKGKDGKGKKGWDGKGKGKSVVMTEAQLQAILGQPLLGLLGLLRLLLRLCILLPPM